jgi:hypothetical protein
MRVGAVLLAALVVAPTAEAAIYVRLMSTTVHRGGLIRLVSNAHAMPVFAIPAAKLSLCRRYDTCASLERRAHPPNKPYVWLGRVPGRGTSTRSLALRLPRSLEIGRYRIFVWCKPCGGSLIPAVEQLRVTP